MELQALEAQLEAILFTLGEAVEVDRLATALEHDVDTVRRVLRNMMDRYDSEDRGIQIIELDGSFQMCTKSSMYESIIKIAHVPKKHVLTEVLLETLSIIAYKQPITRQDMVTILYRYLQYKGMTPDGAKEIGDFTDAGEVSAYALDAVQWSYGTGLVKGTSERALSPRANTTRAQVATIILRYIENISE